MALTRQFVFGMDPYSTETPIWNNYSWASVPDGNSSAKAITCAYIPRTKGTNINLLQESVFIGTTGASLMMQAFRKDYAQDNGSNSTATIITQRLDPTYAEGQTPDTKRFCILEFPGVNPFASGLTVQFCKDVDDPLGQSVSWVTLTSSTTDVRASFPNGLARWIHLKFIDATSQAMRAIFGGFTIHYYSLGSRERQ